ncbi:hypothetical protein [Streptomyces fractus]|uniref:hypothetical protein n=1 Tax=Streptomyces fractus TaxID=641806 RepID=UPI003CF5B5E8
MTTPSRLDSQYGGAVAGIWATVLGRVGRSWTSLGSYRDADVRRFQRQALPVVLAGERQVANLTASYLEQLYKDVDARARRVSLDLDAVTGESLRGVDPVDVYERPFKEVWTALSRGESLDAAVERGGNRLETLAKTDLQLARTHTVREVADELPKFEYTVRVLQGEYDCALCMIASTQRYHKKDLAPIHPGCDCIVKTVTADYDPGQIVDEDRLERIHDLVEDALGRSDRGGRAVDYRKIIIARDHGEIGPVLSYRSQNFTGPDELADRDHGARPDHTPPHRGEDADPPERPRDVEPDIETPQQLGRSITDVDESTPNGQALAHVRDVIASVHTVDREMPEIPLVDEHRHGYLGSYVHTRGGDSVRMSLNPDGPWPHMTAAHELGHFLDHKGLGDSLEAFATETETAEGGILHEWWDAIQQTASYQVLKFMRSQPDGSEWARVQRGDDVESFVLDHEHLDYLMSPAEMFGRSYAQWIATASDDDLLREELELAQDPGSGAVLIAGFTSGYPRQWSEEDFEPVADAFRAVLRRLGLIADEEDE